MKPSRRHAVQLVLAPVATADPGRVAVVREAVVGSLADEVDRVVVDVEEAESLWLVLGAGFCLFALLGPCWQVPRVGAGDFRWKVRRAVRPCRPCSPGRARVLLGRCRRPSRRAAAGLAMGRRLPADFSGAPQSKRRGRLRPSGDGAGPNGGAEP